MPVYNIIAELSVVRAYQVEAINQEEAEDILREEYHYLPSDIISSEIANVTVGD